MTSNLQEKFDMPDVIMQESRDLRRLFTYVSHGKNNPRLGRIHLKTVAGIFWPHVVGHRVMERNLLNLLRPGYSAREHARQLGLDLRRGESHQQLDHLTEQTMRQALEELLGPLVLRPQDAQHAEARRYYAEKHYGDAFEQERTDPDNTDSYTIFRRIETGEHASLRVKVVPPPVDQKDPLFVEIPEPLKLLHCAWLSWVTRMHEPFDPVRTGIEITPAGYLVINWERLLGACKNSRNTAMGGLVGYRLFCETRLSPREICTALETYSGALSLRQILVRRPKVFEVPVSRLSSKTKPSLYIKLGQQSGVCHIEPPDNADYFTVFDPLEMQRKLHLFEGRWHYGMRLRRKNTVYVRNVRKNRGLEHITKRTARVYSFRFEPAKYVVDEAPEPTMLWFDQNTSELIHVIARKNVLHFSRPMLLAQAARVGASDAEAWKRTLDSLKLVETFREDGGTKIHETESRSDFFRAMHRDRLEKLAQATLENFVSLDELGVRAMRRLKKQASKQYAKEGNVGKRYYHDMVLKLAREKLDLNSIRRTARVVLPERGETPVEETFYTLDAIRMFERTAQGTVGIVLKTIDETTILSKGLGPAFYLLAWARFCLHTARLGIDFADIGDSKTNYWRPDEDLAWLARYRRFPRMKPAEYKEILTELPDRTLETLKARIYKVTALLRKVLTPQRMKSKGPGYVAGNPIEAKRLVFILGLLLAQSAHQEEEQFIKFHVSKIVQAPGKNIELAVMPPRYVRDGFFRDLQF